MTCRSVCFCDGDSRGNNEHTLLIPNASHVALTESGNETARERDDWEGGDAGGTPVAPVPEGSGVTLRTFSREENDERPKEDGRKPNSEEAAEIKLLEKEVAECSNRANDLKERLTDAQNLVDRFQKEIADVEHEGEEAKAKLRVFDAKLHLIPKRPGPLEWVDSTWFGGVCNLMVALNLTFMAEHGVVHGFSPILAVCADNIFLTWYVFELGVKIAHHRWYLFFGAITAVWWNWLDLGIVGSGVVDQWIMPMLGLAGGGSTVAMLRLLRLFRLARLLKLVKAFLVADLSWIGESKSFDLFMSGVIGVNAMTIGGELDIKWPGWYWVDNAFLVIYTFDLALRLKRWGCYFFVHPVDISWNWLDFVVVSSGILDSWLMPAIELIQTEVLGVGHKLDTSKFTKVMSLVKLMRLLRVLRLVRVLRSVPPLYTLLIGVIDAFKSMQWVIILTLLTLYGGAIVFTNLVGKGLIFDDQVATPSAALLFGTVSASLFSLFELMNGDTSVIEPIKDLPVGRLLFAGFMVISNWAILAILTAVVSDNMMAASNAFLEEEKRTQDASDAAKNEARLLEIFEEKDADKNGSISKEEWLMMLEDRSTMMELNEGTHLSKEDLTDLFDCLSVEGASNTGKVNYHDLIHSLKANSMVADKRMVLHVMLRMRIMEGHLADQFQSGMDEIKKMVKNGNDAKGSL